MSPPTDIAALTKRAMAVRERFADLEKARAGRPWTKEEIMQGFVGDVGDLMKLVMAKSGLREIPDLDRKMAHELSDCLWSILVLAQLYGIDLQKEFLTSMEELEQTIALKASQTHQAPA
ncbi:MAG: hypothetical protein JNK23_18370 [Opitutaceae bacterium]|nr:hypothetical protein [Opitutaceae bacterium]